MSDFDVGKMLKQKKEQEDSSFNAGDVAKARFASRELLSINNDISRLHDTRLKLYEDMSSRIYDEDGNYKYEFRGDTANALSSFDDRRSQLNADIEEILNTLSAYERYYDAATVQGIKDYLTGYSTSLDEMYDVYNHDAEFFADYIDEDTFNREYDNYRYSNRYAGSTYSDLQGSKQTIENLLNMGVDPALVGDTLETGFGALGIITGNPVDTSSLGNSFERDSLERQLEWIDTHETDKQYADTMTTEEIEAYEIEWQESRYAAQQRYAEAESEYIGAKDAGMYDLDPDRYAEIEREYEEALAELEKYQSANGILYYDMEYDEETEQWVGTNAAITTTMLLEMREHEATMEEINSNPELLSAYNAAFQARSDNKYLEGQIAAAEGEMSAAQASGNTIAYNEAYNKKAALEAQKFENDRIIENFTNKGYDFDGLINYHDWNLSREKYSAEMAENQEFAQEHPVLATLGSIVTAPLTVIEAGADAFRYMGNDSALINIYDNHITNANQVYQSTVSGMIDEATYNKVYELTGNETIAGAASWLTSGAYSGVTSVAQSGLTTLGCTLMFGPTAGPTVALAIMGTEAAASTYTQAVMNGSTNGEALLTATAAGISEALFEKISLDNLIKIGTQWDVSSLSAFFKSTIKNSGAVFVQGLTEGSEEFLTEISNELADRLINGDHSSYYIAIDKYKKMGYSDEDARELADKDFLNEVVTALYGGFIGGNFSGFVATAGKAIPGTIIAGISSYQTNQDYNRKGQSIIDMDNVNPLVEEGKGGNWRLRHLANEVAGVNTEDLSDKGMKRYAHDVGKLYKGVRQAQSKDLLNAKGEVVNKVKDIIRNEVESAGVENVDKAVDILVKKMSGKAFDNPRADSEYFASIKGKEIISKVQESEEYKAAAEEFNVSEKNKKASDTIKLTSEMSSEKVKEKLLDKSGYKTSGSEKVLIDATDEVVDSFLITSIDKKDITLDVVAGDKHHKVVAGELRLNDDLAVILDGLRKINENFGLDESTANKMLTLWDGYNGDVLTFLQGVENSFMYGQYNMRFDFERNNEVNKLPEYIRNEVFEFGREYKQKVTEEETASLKKSAVTKAKNKVTFAKGVTYEQLNENQKVLVDVARIIADEYDFDLEIFRSPKVNGKSVGENGSWQTSKNLMRLDIDAGTIDGKSLILFTQSHELTHLIKARSPEEFKIFADYLVETYGKKGDSVDELVRAKMANSIIAAEKMEDREALSYDEAFEEVVAESCVEFLADPKLRERIIDIENIDKGLGQKIKDFIKNILAKLEKVIEGLKFESEEAKRVRDFDVESLEKLKDLWVAGLKASKKNVLEARARTAEEQEAIKAFGKDLGNVETNEDGDVTLISNKDNSVQMYSEATWLKGGKAALINALTRNEHTQEEIRDTIKMVEDSLDYLKILAAGDAEMRGYTELADHLTAEIMTDVIHGKQVLHTIVNNGDYPVNLDLALICKKRVAYMRLMSRLIEDGVMENVVYDGDAIAKVNAILRKNGFETACLGCFGESRRLQFQTWAEVIVQEWNGEVDRRNKNAGSFNYAKNALTDASSLTDEEIARLEKELKGKKTNDQGNLNLGQGSVRTRMGKLLDAVPTLQKHITVADLLTPEGITKLKAENPNLFSLVKSRYGAASPKIVQNYNPYASELANLTFESVKRITTNAVSGATDYIAQAEEELKDSRPIKPKKSMSDKKFNEMPEKAEWDAKVQTLAMRKYLYDIGGARMQSFSDFMIENVFDYLQIFADLSANRFPLHSYTKEASFLRLFGMTGAKINGSLIAHVDKRFGKQYAGLLPAEEAKNGNAILVHTADGDFAIGFDDYARHIATKGTDGETFIQSIGMKDIIALQLDKRYSANVGSITIGVSDIQILAMLDSPLFRMVIPYHASGMLPQFAELVGVDLYNDYTDYQNTTVRQYYDLNKMPLPDEIDKNGKVKQGKLRKANGDEIKADTSYSFNAELQKIGDPKQVANNYIAWCNEFHEIYDGDTLVGYAKFNPKFSNSPYGTDFTKHENYYKLLEDFNVYDGITEQYAQQGAVQMIFPSAENRLSMQELEEYKQRLRDTGIFNEKEIEKYAQKANMTFDELVKAEVKNRIEYEDEQNPKFDSTVKEIEDELLKSYKRIDKRIETFDEYLKLKESDSKASKEALKNMKPMTRTYFQDRVTPEEDAAYMDAYYDGDEDVMQSLVDKVANRLGYKYKAYHHTENGFTVFDLNKARKSMDIQGFYFSADKDAESEYGSVRYDTYLKMDKPYIVDSKEKAQAIPFDLGKENAGVIAREWLQNQGYDSVIRKAEYYGAEADEYIVFDSSQIKSAEPMTFADDEYGEGDIIPLSERFNEAQDDIRYQDREIGYGKLTQERIDDLISYNRAGSRVDYASAWIATIDPTTFINLTLPYETRVKDREVFDKEVQGDHGNVMGDRDYIADLKNSGQMPRLRVDIDTGKVIGHDGRHRMRALEMAGASRTPIEIIFYKDGSVYKGNNNGVRLESIDVKRLTSQFDDKFYLQTHGYIHRIIPLNEDHRAEIEKEYLVKSLDIKYGNAIAYQDRPVSDREILVDAMSNSEELSMEDKNRLENYRVKIDNINKLEKELSDVGKQIHEIITTKGLKGTERKNKLDSLYARSNTLRKQISRLDGELLRIEAMKPIQNLVEIRKKQIIKAHNQKAQEQRHKNVEGRNKTATKNKIKKVVKALESLYNNPTKERNVKIEFQDMVKKALIMADALFDDTSLSAYNILSGDITIELESDEEVLVAEWKKVLAARDNYQKLLDGMERSGGKDIYPGNHEALLKDISKCNDKLKRLESKLSGVIERQGKRINNNSVKAAVESLAKAYRSLNESSEGYANAAYNEYVDKRLTALVDALDGVTVKSMTLTQLDELYHAYKMVLTTVRTANEIFVKNKRMSVIDMGESVINEIKKVAKITPDKIANIRCLRDYAWKELKPIYAFKRIGSDTFMDLFWEVMKGESVYARDTKEAMDFFQGLSKKYGFDSWNLDATTDFKLADGRVFSISLDEIMAIYAYSKREQAIPHMTEGGFVFDDKKFFTKSTEKGIKGKVVQYERTAAEAYRISHDVFRAIENSLTEEQKKFADEMQKYLTSMGDKGNEISRVLYGIDIFNEEVYFPLVSSDDFKQSLNNPAGEVKLKNSGMTKATVPHAKNPIVLKGFMDVWNAHVDKMSTYHAMVLPIENINKVFNYTGYANQDISVSVKSILNGAYGSSAADYISTFLQDLNGGVKVQNSGGLVSKLMSNFKKTAVAASLSVVVQQPFAVIRAMAEINPKYFVGKSDLKHNETWEELKRYAPVAIIKEMGGFDIGSGQQTADYITAKEYHGIKEKAKGFFKDSNYRDEALMWTASKADEIGWNTIWNAVKREIADTTTLKVGSEEFLQACGDRFTEVIAYTQVYDSVVSRSGWMRNKGEIAKMATAFMGEATTTVNMLFNAILQVKRGTISKGKATAIVGATVASIVLSAVAKSFIGALRDDDEDESYLEKYGQALGSNIISDINPLNMLPFVRDVVSLFEGWDVERTDMAVIKDIKDAFDGLDSDTKSDWRKTEDLLGAIAALFGIPAKNLIRTAREGRNLIANIFDENTYEFGDVTSGIGEGVFGEKNVAEANKAFKWGNTDKGNEIIDEVIAEKVDGGMTQKEAEASVRSSLTSYWKERYIEAYKRNDTDEMRKIRKILASTGLYDDVLETCSDWVKSIKS